MALDSGQKDWFVVDAKVLSYDEAWRLQQDIVDAIHRERIIKDVVLLIEHPPVFTVGRRGGRDHLRVSENFLKEKNIPVIQVERGGNITYHGPGQLVGYPIIHLQKNRLGIPEFTNLIEEVMIQSSGEMGVHATRNPKNPGIWIGNSKLGSIGIAIRHGISFHGFSLNINLSMKPFEWINPCGFNDIQMTSIKKQGAPDISVQTTKNIVMKHIENIFSVKLIPADMKELNRLLAGN